jgi:hypothetical protein
MANTYTLIASSTVGSGGAGSVEFTSIPNTYTDLLIKFSPRNDGQVWGKLSFNGSSTGYIYKSLNADGSSVGADASTDNNYTIFAPSPSQTANTFGITEIYIPNYTSSNYKSASFESLTENMAVAVYMRMYAFVWSNTAAITSIQLTSHNSPSNKWVQYTTAYLYGIKNS